MENCDADQVGVTKLDEADAIERAIILLARAEWQAPTVLEGRIRLREGRVVEKVDGGTGAATRSSGLRGKKAINIDG